MDLPSTLVLIPLSLWTIYPVVKPQTAEIPVIPLSSVHKEAQASQFLFNGCLSNMFFISPVIMKYPSVTPGFLLPELAGFFLSDLNLYLMQCKSVVSLPFSLDEKGLVHPCCSLSCTLKICHVTPQYSLC